MAKTITIIGDSGSEEQQHFTGDMTKWENGWYVNGWNVTDTSRTIAIVNNKKVIIIRTNGQIQTGPWCGTNCTGDLWTCLSSGVPRITHLVVECQ